jgi:hypothetical protein
MLSAAFRVACSRLDRGHGGSPSDRRARRRDGQMDRKRNAAWTLEGRGVAEGVFTSAVLLQRMPFGLVGMEVGIANRPQCSRSRIQSSNRSPLIGGSTCFSRP